METFIPAYLRALGEHLTDHVPPEKMLATMLAATQRMIDNNNFRKTLKESFDLYFYEPLGLNEQDMKGHFSKFYAEIFPSLRNTTQIRPEAFDFILTALSRGYKIGVATNPLFPKTAILQRLVWAGLPYNEIPFVLIPSYETFHFAKPNPAFFAEFLGRIGWPDGPILMVGNDPDHDVKGAQTMGIPIFWISDNGDQLLPGQSEPDGSGALVDVLPWIDTQPRGSLEPNFTTPSAIIAILRGSPAALSILLSKVHRDLWSWQPDQSAWCLTEIICHLRDVEREINLPRLRKVLQDVNPFIPGIDSDSWADIRGYIQQDGEAAFADFLAARDETLDILDHLEEDAWARPIRHAIFGPTDLSELVRINAGHERVHGRQIFEVIEKHQARVSSAQADQT